MSDSGNSVQVASDFGSVEEVARFFGSTEIRDDRCYFTTALDREVSVRYEASPVLFDRPGTPTPDLGVYFDTFPRAVQITEDLVADEVAVAVSCIMSQDLIRSGTYYYEDLRLAFWDWDGDGLFVASDRSVWSRPESRVLRERLMGAAISFELTSLDPTLTFGLNMSAFDSIANRWVDTGYWPKPEGWERFGRVLAVGSVLKVATGLEMHRYGIEIRVELPTVQAFLRDLVDVADTDRDRLAAVPWRTVMVDVTALLINAEWDLPGRLQAQAWDQLRSEAQERAAETKVDTTRF